MSSNSNNVSEDPIKSSGRYIQLLVAFKIKYYDQESGLYKEEIMSKIVSKYDHITIMFGYYDKVDLLSSTTFKQIMLFLDEYLETEMGIDGEITILSVTPIYGVLNDA